MFSFSRDFACKSQVLPLVALAFGQNQRLMQERFSLPSGLGIDILKNESHKFRRSGIQNDALRKRYFITFTPPISNYANVYLLSKTGLPVQLSCRRGRSGLFRRYLRFVAFRDRSRP